MVSSISKTEIAELPLAQFKGEIKVIETPEDAFEAVNYLNRFHILGFDTETRPAFKKGQSHKIALIQLAVEDICFLFRLNLIGYPDCLSEIISNPEIKKIGLSLKDDFSAIRKRAPFIHNGFIELQSFVKKYGIEEKGLQRIYAILFGERISKKQRLTNWEAPVLSEGQQNYAALDAWACLKIYKKLNEFREGKDN